MKNAILENKNIFDVSGKVALISGTGSGLGKGYSHVFAESGCTVLCTDINVEAAKKTAEEITEDGGIAFAYALDVTDTNYVTKMVTQFVHEYGKIDILINNAGTECAEPFLAVSPEHFDMITDVNLRGSYFLAQAVAKNMAKSGGGKIINVASVAGYVGFDQCSVYACTKAAVMSFTKTMAFELAKDNIQVNSISPGFFYTPMTKPFLEDPKDLEATLKALPLGRLGTVRDLAGALLFLASSASDYVTGIDVIVDAGWLAV